MAARRAIRRGEAPLPTDSEADRSPAPEAEREGALSQPGDGASLDVPMEEAPVARPGQQAAPDIPMEDWSAEQVIANSSQLLRGGLDDEEGDNAEPDWDDEEPEEEDLEQLPPEGEEEETALDREQRPPSRFIRDTRDLFARWRAEVYAPAPRRPSPPQLHL